MSNFIMSSR